jgi:chemotaxis signal transduction protein
MAAATEAVPGARYGYVVSRFGLLVPPRVSSEIVLQPALFPMPLAPAWMLGLMNARGNVAPVFDLCRLLEGAPHPRPNSVLLLDQGPWMAGLVVDKLPHTVDPKPGTAAATSIPAAMQAFFSYAGQAAGQAWWEFDHRACFAKLSAAEPF